MKKKIIGVAANQHYQNNQDFFDQQFTYSPQGFINGVHQAGGVPILLPISDPELASDYIATIDKLLLAGGQDVTPFLYGEEPHPKLGPTSIDRDSFEMALIKEAIKQNKPIFTVCRGTQLLNVTLGENTICFPLFPISAYILLPSKEILHWLPYLVNVHRSIHTIIKLLKT